MQEKNFKKTRDPKTVRNPIIYYDKLKENNVIGEAVNSNEAFYRFNSVKDKPLIASLVTPYDQAIDNTYYLSDSISDDSINFYNDNLVQLLQTRLNYTLNQNLYIIFLDGVYKLVKDYVTDESTDPRTGNFLENCRYNILTYNSFSDTLRVYKHNRDARFEFNGSPDYISNGSTASDALINGMAMYMNQYARKYSVMINSCIIADKRFNLKSFGIHYMAEEGIDQSYVSDADIIGFGIGVINQVANEDLNKFFEILQVNIVQMVSQFTKQRLYSPQDKDDLPKYTEKINSKNDKDDFPGIDIIQF